MMINLVTNELLKIYESKIDLVKKYIHLKHEAMIMKYNQKSELTRKIAEGWLAYGISSRIISP